MLSRVYGSNLTPLFQSNRNAPCPYVFSAGTILSPEAIRAMFSRGVAQARARQSPPQSLVPEFIGQCPSGFEVLAV